MKLLSESLEDLAARVNKLEDSAVVDTALARAEANELTGGT
jgi:hypothetical protein